MTNDFDRKVTGYNIYKHAYGWFISGLQDPVTLNMAAGPGEILAILVHRTTGTDADFHVHATITITIDTLLYYIGAWCSLLEGNLNYNFLGQFASNNLNDTFTRSSQQFRLKIPYNQTASVTFTANGYNDGFISVLYRCGD